MSDFTPEQIENDELTDFNRVLGELINQKFVVLDSIRSTDLTKRKRFFWFRCQHPAISNERYIIDVIDTSVSPVACTTALNFMDNIVEISCELY